MVEMVVGHWPEEKFGGQILVRGVGGNGGGCKGGEVVWVCQRGWCIVHSWWWLFGVMCLKVKASLMSLKLKSSCEVAGSECL